MVFTIAERIGIQLFLKIKKMSIEKLFNDQHENKLVTEFKETGSVKNKE